MGRGNRRDSNPVNPLFDACARGGRGKSYSGDCFGGGRKRANSAPAACLSEAQCFGGGRTRRASSSVDYFVKSVGGMITGKRELTPLEKLENGWREFVNGIAAACCGFGRGGKQ